MQYVTILMPVAPFSVPYLAESIRSVQAQTFEDWELALYQDGLSEEVAQIAQEAVAHDARIVYHFGEDQVGGAKARNRCLDHAHGGWAVIWDADDLCLPERLQIQLEHARLISWAGVVLGWASPIAANGDTLERAWYTDIRKVPFEDIPRTMLSPEQRGLNFVAHGTAMIRAGLLRQGGGYRDTKAGRRPHDYDLWLRLWRQGVACTGVEEIVQYHRLHDNSLSAKWSATRVDAEAIWDDVVIHGR